MSLPSQAIVASPVPTPKSRPAWRWTRNILIVLAALGIVAVFIWQSVTSGGNPQVTGAHMSSLAVAVNAGILVFREGLEAILVLAALTASLTRSAEGYWKPVSIGAGLSFLATIATWFVVVALIASINAPELDIQAGTGLLAIIVLLVIMNWFFHKLYWTGWITHHNRRKRNLVDGSVGGASLYRGLMLVGFTSVYREGFEVVLFLQALRQQHPHMVLYGAIIGLFLTAIVAVLTFAAHAKLPYRKMLIATGILLGVVLIVMVGESVQEMQQAHWISTTYAGFHLPKWLLMWFAIYPSIESLTAQALAVAYVLGTYSLARMLVQRRHRKARETSPSAVGRSATS